jgi:hypothetical protein
MNKLTKYIVKRAAKQATNQGDHKRKITEFYKILVKAARETFTEDNKPTLDCFLIQCHKEALKE